MWTFFNDKHILNSLKIFRIFPSFGAQAKDLGFGDILKSLDVASSIINDETLKEMMCNIHL